MLWSALLRRPVRLVLHEDNESTITVIASGYSQQLRHLAKHHRVSLSLVHEMCQASDVEVRFCPTTLQKADFLTKGLDRAKLSAALDLINLR